MRISFSVRKHYHQSYHMSIPPYLISSSGYARRDVHRCVYWSEVLTLCSTLSIDDQTFDLTILIFGQVTIQFLCQDTSSDITFTGNLEDIESRMDFTCTSSHKPDEGQYCVCFIENNCCKLFAYYSINLWSVY